MKWTWRTYLLHSKACSSPINERKWLPERHPKIINCKFRFKSNALARADIKMTTLRTYAFSKLVTMIKKNYLKGHRKSRAYKMTISERCHAQQPDYDLDTYVMDWLTRLRYGYMCYAWTQRYSTKKHGSTKLPQIIIPLSSTPMRQANSSIRQLVADINEV